MSDPKLRAAAEAALATGRARRARRHLLLVELRRTLEAGDLQAALGVSAELEELEGVDAPAGDRAHTRLG
jgi:hypothetical protein